MIYEILLTGQNNALTNKEISSLLGLNKREITRAIEKERRDGFPICASADGYYIAANKEEMNTYCKHLHHRAAEIYKTRSACMKTIEKLP